MGYTWSQFRGRVATFLTDRTPSKDFAAETIATFVKSRAALDHLGDEKLYGIYSNKFTALRRRLAGTPVAANDAEIDDKVRALCSARAPSDTMLVQAVAEYANAALGSRDFGRYNKLRLDLLGHRAVATGAQIRTQVRALLTDSAPSDTVLVDCLAEFVKATLAGSSLERFERLRRSLLGYTTALNTGVLTDLVKPKLSTSAPTDDRLTVAIAEFVSAAIGSKDYTRYEALKRDLVGYTSSMTVDAMKAAVRKLITDATVSNDTVVAAVAEYVKAKLEREVNRELEAHNSFMKSYEAMRARLVGFQMNLSSTDLRTAVKVLLPLDKDRLDMDTFINRQIELAELDIRGMGPLLDDLIAKARSDIAGHGELISQLVASGKASVESFSTLVDNIIDQGVSDVESLETWFAAQCDAAKSEINSLAARVDAEIRAGAMDLQRYIDGYRTGHSTKFVEENAEHYGYASVVIPPEGARIREAWIVYGSFDNPVAHRDKATLVPWAERQERMIAVPTGSAQFSLNPTASRCLVTPRLSEEDKVWLEIFHDGLKSDFGGSDVTPFDLQAAKATALYVKVSLAGDLGISQTEMAKLAAEYAGLRSQIYLDFNERRGLYEPDTMREEPGYPLSADSAPLPGADANPPA